MANISKIKLPNGNTYNIVDSTISTWARAANKPSYTASEISNALYKDGAHVADGITYSYGIYRLDNSVVEIPVYNATITSDSQITTKKYVDDSISTAINALPSPMIYKGSVGTDGTITSLPAAAASNEGYTYKVITALSTPVAAKVGDTVISNGSVWTVIPSGDEPSGTITSVAASGSGGITISGSPITSSGTITVGLNLSTAINGLGEGTSNANRNDYIVAQYASGGTTTTTYHRRSLAHIFAALNKSDITTALGYTPPTTDTNTHRPIQMNGTEILGNNTTALNLKAGTNVSLSNSSGTVTITSTDTNTTYSAGTGLGLSGTTFSVKLGYTTSGNNRAVQADSSGNLYVVQKDDNTWRGIQDNLTSSTNTTESLSAKQGYLLANGSARDSTKLPLTGGNVTGPVTFGDSISIDDLTAGQLVVSGGASVANNLQVNTINGVTVGSSPKFTDTNTVTTATTTGSGNAVTAVSASNGALTITKGTTFLTAHNTYTVSTTGSGNAVTAVSLSGTTLTVTKGTTFPTTNTTYGIATYNTNGLVKPWYSHTAASTGPTAGTNATAVAVNTITTTAGKYYAVEMDNAGRMFVNVPWTNTTYSSQAAASGGTAVSLVTTGEKYTWNSKAAGSHTHGNITSGGDITATATIASGDRLVINDESASKIINSSITFGTSTTQFLANNGTWQTPASGSSVITRTATLAANSWSSGTQTVTVSGVTSSNNVIVSSAPSSYQAYISAGVYCSAQGSNSLTFTCITTPSSALTVNVLILG